MATFFKKKNLNQSFVSLGERYLLPTYARLPVCFIKGKGVWLWDANGKKYLDFVAGIAVDNLGHAPRVIQRALVDQAKKLLHISNLFHIESQSRLAQALVEKTGLHQAFFCNSGTEAVEACIKLARYWSFKNFGDTRREIIVTQNSFHGRTLGALSATGQQKYQKGFEPLLAGFKFVPFDDVEALRCAFSGGSVCAVLLEPIQAEGGVRIPHAGYLKAVQKLCEEHHCLLILDEVQVGMGRTGTFLACEKEGVKPDLLALAKGLGGGFPIGACVAGKKVASFVEPGIHASTFGGNPMACRAALATLSVTGKKAFLKGVLQKGKYIVGQLEKLQKKYPIIREVRGRGLIVACELSRPQAKPIVRRCLAEGLVINALQEKVLRFVPPLIITKAEIDWGLNILEKIFGEISPS